jgi:hypothetical protein
MNEQAHAKNTHKPSDAWLMKIWTYAILPIIPLGIIGLSFFGEGSRGSLAGEQFIFILFCSSLIYGLHKRQKWAWYVNWIAVLPLAVFPIKFGGAVGGIIGVFWIMWNLAAWRRLKYIFT